MPHRQKMGRKKAREIAASKELVAARKRRLSKAKRLSAQEAEK